MFDELNNIMNSRSNNGFIKVAQLYPYDIGKIKELIANNIINEANFDNQTLKRRYGLPINVNKASENQLNKMKLRELKEKLIPARNRKRQLIFRNHYDNLDASMSIMDCQLGFDILRSKIDKMKRIANKVLNDEFEYKYKESSLFEFKWRMDHKRVNDKNIFKDNKNDRVNSNDIPRNKEDNQTVCNNFSKNKEIDFYLPKFEKFKANKICHELNENFIKKDSLIKTNKHNQKEDHFFEKDVNISEENYRFSLAKKRTAFFVNESREDSYYEKEDKNFMQNQNQHENKNDLEYTQHSDENDEIDLISRQLAEYINTGINTTDNKVEEFKQNERKSFTTKDKHFSFKHFINLGELNESDKALDKDTINPLNNNEKNKKNFKSKHIKKKSLSSLELISLLNIKKLPEEKKSVPVEVESTKTSCNLNSLKTHHIDDNYIFTNDILRQSDYQNSCEVNISGFDFNEIFEEEDTQQFKQIALQKLNYFLEVNEKEEKFKDESEIVNRNEKSNLIDEKYFKEFDSINCNQNSVKKQNISLYDKYNCKEKIPHLCKKFKKNPFMFYTEFPDDDVLKMCNITSPDFKFSNETVNKSMSSNKISLSIRSKSNKKEKKSRENNTSTLENLTLSEIK